MPELKDIYLLLLHGREDFFQDMDEMGFDGPVFGPYKWFHETYGQTIHLSDNEHNDVWIQLVDGFICYGGAFYGDFEISSHFEGVKDAIIGAVDEDFKFPDGFRMKPAGMESVPRDEVERMVQQATDIEMSRQVDCESYHRSEVEWRIRNSTYAHLKKMIADNEIDSDKFILDEESMDYQQRYIDKFIKIGKLAGHEAEPGGGGWMNIFVALENGNYLVFGNVNGPLGYNLNDSDDRELVSDEMVTCFDLVSCEEAARFIKEAVTLRSEKREGK